MCYKSRLFRNYPHVTFAEMMVTELVNNYYTRLTSDITKYYQHRQVMHLNDLPGVESFFHGLSLVLYSFAAFL